MRELLDAIRSGKRPDLEGNEYYILVLSGTGGRVMVRSWEEGSYEQLADNVARWFTDLQINTIFGTLPAASPRIQAVIECILPPKKSSQQREDWLKPATTIRAALWSAAIDGLPVPFSAAARVVEQFRSFVLTGGFENSRPQCPAERFADSLATLDPHGPTQGLPPSQRFRRFRRDCKYETTLES